MMKRVKEDDVIVAQGEITPEMYKIVYGKAAVYLNYGKEDEYLAGILSEQKCFGEFGLISGMASPYTVCAVTDMMLMTIEPKDLEKFISENPKDVLLIMKNMINMINIMKGNIDILTNELSHPESSMKNIDIMAAKLRKYALYEQTEDPAYLIRG